MKFLLLKRVLTITLVFAVLILSGCFGGDDEPSESTVTAPPIEQIAFYRLVESEEFTIQVPEDWETIQHFTSAFPKNTLVAFRTNLREHDFLANINVVRNQVPEGITSKDYALEMFETVSKQMLNLKKLDERQVNLIIGTQTIPTFIFEFEGTNDSATRTRGFIQTYGVKGTTAYIVTGTYALSDTELNIDRVKQSVPTFRLK